MEDGAGAFDGAAASRFSADAARDVVAYFRNKLASSDPAAGARGGDDVRASYAAFEAAPVAIAEEEPPSDARVGFAHLALGDANEVRAVGGRVTSMLALNAARAEGLTLHCRTGRRTTDADGATASERSSQGEGFAVYDTAEDCVSSAGAAGTRVAVARVVAWGARRTIAAAKGSRRACAFVCLREILPLPPSRSGADAKAPATAASRESSYLR